MLSKFKNFCIVILLLFCCNVNTYSASYQDIYNEAWSIAETNFYDSSMNHQNWNYWKEHYRGKIATQDDLMVAIETTLASLDDIYTRYLPQTNFSDEHNNIHEDLKSLTNRTHYFKTKIPKNIKYIRFDTMMNKNLPTEISNVIKEAEKNPDFKGYIIDLRDNGGGLVKNATDISSLLMNDKVVLYAQTNSNKLVNKTKKNGCITQKPVILLVNFNTASACEVLSGALKDNNRATIIGTTTFGKGVIQKIIKLSDNSGLHITVMSYHTPNNTEINKHGVEPDIKICFTRKDIIFHNDVQLKRAIKLLSNDSQNQHK